MGLLRDPDYMRRIRSNMWITRQHQKQVRRERKQLAAERAAFKPESILIRKTDTAPAASR